ncbi:MAG: hypothetical protein IT424_08020 [Pirellulales bacterium]|nr:hypothetical protein [Pirellulales bacterium]
MKVLTVASIVILLTGGQAVSMAHGPQIQITAVADKIVTRELILDSPYSTRLSEPKFAYVMPLGEYLGAWYARPNGAHDAVLQAPAFYSGPGIAYGYGYEAFGSLATGFAAGSQLSMSFTGGLLRWNGQALVDAGTAQLEAFRGSFSAPAAMVRTNDGGPSANLNLPAVSFASEGAEAHSTVRFRLLGDGASSASTGPDGVYLASLRLESNQSGLAASDPFYFVLSKNAAANEVVAAVNSLRLESHLVQFVPEPATVVPCLAGLWAALSAARTFRRGAQR